MSYKPLQDDNPGKNVVVVELQQVAAMSDTLHMRQLLPDEEEEGSHSELDQEDDKELIPSSLGEYDDYEEILKVVGFGLGHVLLLLGTGVALSSDAVEVLSISFALPILRRPSELDISNWQNGLLSSIIFIGMLIGGYSWGGIADISGRRLTLVTSLTINGIFGAASAFSPNFTVLVILRFISGIGVGGSLPIISAYNSEFIMTRYRGPYLGTLSGFWMIGALLCGGIAWALLPLEASLSLGGSYSLHSWRLYILVSALPSLIGAVLFFIMPESPRFLLEIGNEQRSIKILKRMYNLNHIHQRRKVPSFPVKSIKLANIKSTNVAAASTIGGATNKTTTMGYKKRVVSVVTGIKEILRRTVQLFHRKFLRSTSLMLAIFFCLSFGSYGVTLWYPSYIDRLSREGLDDNVFHEDCNHTLFNYTINSSDQSVDDIFCSCPHTKYRSSLFYNMSLPSWWMKDSLLYSMDIMEGRYEWVWFENVTMETVNFNQVTLHNAFICNSSWNNLLFVDVMFDNCSFCGINSENVSFISSRFINSTLNSIILDGLSDTEVNELFSVTNNRTQCDDVIQPSGTCLNEPSEVDLGQEYFYDFLIAGSAFPGNVVSAIAVYFIVRSYWLSFSFLLSTITVFLLFFVHTEVYAVLILCMFKAITIPGWNVTSLIVAEIYPTSLRTTANGVLLLVARIGAIIGTYVFGAFTNTSQISVPILLTAVVLFVACVASIFLPKTTRKTALQ